VRKALVITYFFPPANSVASPRVQAFADNFHTHGIHPVIVTRHWTGKENEWVDFLTENNTPVTFSKEKNFSVYRFPYVIASKRKTLAQNSKLFSKLYHFTNPVLGHFNTEVNAYKSLFNFLNEHLKTNHYDFILVSAPPFNSVRLGYELSQKFAIPLVLDLRDIWQTLLGAEDAELSVKQKFFLYFNKRYAKKWFSAAKLIATVSEPLAEEIMSVYHKKPVVVTNGYEDSIFKTLLPKTPNGKFNFTIVGTIYPTQDISILIEGLNKFKQMRPDHKLKLNFIGINTIAEVGDKIKAALKDFDLLTTGKIERIKALQYLADAQILFYSGWRGHKGIYSTKIFEYLGARKNILIAPGDDNVIDELLNKTKAGNVANSPEEFYHHLITAYSQWETNGTISYFGIEKEILKYSRENQTEKFAREILHAIS